MSHRAAIDQPRVPVSDFLKVDAACDRFEDALRAGGDPDLSAHLAAIEGPARAAAFRDLLGLEVEYRRRRGESPAAASYLARFPGLSEVVDSIFAQTRPVSDSEVKTRPDDPDSSGDGRLEPGEVDGLLGAGYEVYKLLGRGGMGVVYEARQVALDRPVALKLIRSRGFATAAELLRFRNEAEAVARLDHPHIVPIFEVGESSGQPYFSMKLVDGVSLDRRLDEYLDNPRASARLVATIAEAIDHAHRRGVLHRDLKPANILVDSLGEPHVTDFGLAKRTDIDAGLTRTDALIGTPSYMAPEQTSRDPGTVSTATDVYGLGTILYALLTGRAPFSGTTLVEMLDLVRTQEPEPPSRINPKVPRDLEVICGKCLQKDPSRRYESALALAEDLKRWLDGEPIRARPVPAMVRAGMWCRRNKMLATAAGVAALSIVAGLAGVAWKWREAVRERARAEAVVELLTDRLLARADAELDPIGRNPTVRELLDDAAARLGGWLDDQPDVEAQVRETVGGAYLSLGQFGPAEEQLRRAIDLDAKANGPRGRVGLLAVNRLGTLLDRTDRAAEAVASLRRNLDDCRRSLGPDDPVTLDADERLASALWHLGNLDEAEAVLRRNLRDRDRVFLPNHAATLRSVYLLSRLLRERGKLDEARELAYRFAHDIQCASGSNHPDLILALTNQGDVARDQGNRADAERYYRHAAVEAARILGTNHATARQAEANLSRFLTSAAISSH